MCGSEMKFAPDLLWDDRGVALRVPKGLDCVPNSDLIGSESISAHAVQAHESEMRLVTK